MTTPLRIVMAQLDFLVGDVAANAARVIDAAQRARDELRADAIVFPELTLTGYPPEDLLLRPLLHDQIMSALHDIRHAVTGIDVVIGYPQREQGALYNAAALIRDGKILGTYFKQLLPNYSVFDEKRYFVAGHEPCVVDIKGVPVGITVCEDIWQAGPVEAAVEAGARLIINLNASPFHFKKGQDREEAVSQRAQLCGVPIVYVNLVGGQDELVFDGGSFIVNAQGQITQHAPVFVEELVVTEYDLVQEQVVPRSADIAPALAAEESIYKAIVLGVRDYIEKNGFKGVVIGLSGGIDSALTLALAVDAIGAERVEVVMMPSRYTAEMSIEDAQSEARQLGVEYHVIPVEPAYTCFLDSLAEEFAGTSPDTTEENIQARCRGVILMAISNKKRKIVLTTGNKSEMAVGYATLYGDMAGGFAPIKDVPKMMVYQLAEYRNTISPVIPRRVLERPPSAELAPDQKDEDTLPPYDVLDPILEMYIEQDMSVDDIISRGFDHATVKRVITMVYRNEYKRRQAPPGVRITRRAFGRDRRYPITSGFIENYRVSKKNNIEPRNIS